MLLFEELSKTTVQDYIDQFIAKEGSGEKALQMLFRDYPNNDDVSSVTVKTIVLDNIYSTRIRKIDLPFVIQHIVDNSNEINQLLESEKREYKLYSIIAFIPNKGVNNVYSFATKYLSFIKPELYPIMDSYSRDLLKEYHNAYPDIIPKIIGDDDYESFCMAFDAFHEKLNEITGYAFSAKETDMFIWQYAKQNLKKT